eukprot:1074435-Pelagomonas_calceolata.AAC.4
MPLPPLLHVHAASKQLPPLQPMQKQQLPPVQPPPPEQQADSTKDGGVTQDADPPSTAEPVAAGPSDRMNAENQLPPSKAAAAQPPSSVAPSACDPEGSGQHPPTVQPTNPAVGKTPDAPSLPSPLCPSNPAEDNAQDAPVLPMAGEKARSAEDLKSTGEEQAPSQPANDLPRPSPEAAHPPHGAKDQPLHGNPMADPPVSLSPCWTAAWTCTLPRSHTIGDVETIWVGVHQAVGQGHHSAAGPGAKPLIWLEKVVIEARAVEDPAGKQKQQQHTGPLRWEAHYRGWLVGKDPEPSHTDTADAARLSQHTPQQQQQQQRVQQLQEQVFLSGAKKQQLSHSKPPLWHSDQAEGMNLASIPSEIVLQPDPMVWEEWDMQVRQSVLLRAGSRFSDMCEWNSEVRLPHARLPLLFWRTAKPFVGTHWSALFPVSNNDVRHPGRALCLSGLRKMQATFLVQECSMEQASHP